MIIFRSAQILLVTGTPSFNLADLAQPSTSYLLPYLIAGSLVVTPNLAWGALSYAAISFGAILATVVIIVKSASNPRLAFLFLVLLSFTSTNLLFSLSGWDHIWQGLFFALTFLAITKNVRNVPAVSVGIGVLAALGVLSRPDGALVGLGLVFSAFLALRATGDSVGKSLLPLVSFSFLGIVAMITNFQQFGWVLPTTVRLKSGAVRSIAESWDYFFSHSVLSFSVITLFLALVPLALLIPSRSRAVFWPLIVGVFGSVVVAFFNSDVFPGGRMFWGPTIALSLVVLGSMSPGPRGDRERIIGPKRIILRLLVGGFVVGSLALASSSIPFRQEGTGIITSENIAGTTKPLLFLQAKWIESYLSSSDGAVGTFYAGVAAHLPETFAVADLLGKGDELIARLPHKHGPPGHTKWDFEATIQKWNPQAIILLPDSRNPNDEDFIEEAQRIVASNKDYSFVPELLIEPMVRQDFLWCQIIFDLGDDESISSPILLRADIANNLRSRPDLTCFVLEPVVHRP